MSEKLTAAKIHATEGGVLAVHWAEDGDVWLTVEKDPEQMSSMERMYFERSGQVTLRFCTHMGGGKTPATRKALLDLMKAIEQDGGKTQ